MELNANFESNQNLYLMNTFLRQKKIYKATNEGASILEITIKGSFDELTTFQDELEGSIGLQFNLKHQDNTNFDVPYITASILNNKLILTTSNGNPLDGKTGLSLFIKDWFVEEFYDYLYNQQIEHFPTTSSAIMATIKVIKDREPYEFEFDFPKNRFDDEPIQNFRLKINNSETFYECNENGRDIRDVIGYRKIKSYALELINQINSFNKIVKLDQ